ncbi:MAG: DUF4184 family protein [Panacagrimonas sp.]
MHRRATVPFTLAHPAAVIPLGRYGDLTALVIGSMVPDFAYILGTPIPRYLSHSVLGLFVFCLPLGLVAYVTYCGLLRSPLVALAPEGFARRLGPQRLLPRTGREWMLIGNAILIGALTHLLWDEFTHASWRQGQLFPWLDAELMSVGGQPLRALDAFGYLSAVVGIGLIAGWTLRWWRRTAPAYPVPVPAGPRMRIEVRIAVLIAAAIAIAAFMRMAARDDGDTPLAALAAGAGLQGLALSIFVYATVWQLLRCLAPRFRPTSSTDR